MLLKRKGFPEVGEFVLCTVTNIQYNSVFVRLNEYDRSGLIHISEVSPGRIRNIRDFVKEGKKIVCKVLRINEEKGYIDLSLRRVNTIQRIKKNEEYKQEIKAERLLEHVGKDLKLDLEKMYKEAGYKILDNYDNLTDCFQDIVNNNVDLTKLDIKDKIAKKIEELVKERIKPLIVLIKGIFKISTKESNGVEIVKNVLNNMINKGVNIVYLGAPKYKVSVEDKDYKRAEIKLKEAVDSSLQLAKKLKAEAEFNRKNA